MIMSAIVERFIDIRLPGDLQDQFATKPELRTAFHKFIRGEATMIYNSITGELRFVPNQPQTTKPKDP